MTRMGGRRNPWRVQVGKAERKRHLKEAIVVRRILQWICNRMI